MLKFYLIFTGVVSFVTLLLFIIDKFRSKREELYRIPEELLLALTSLGGAVGALLGIYLVRHKTNFKTKFHFIIGTWVAIAIQAGIAVLAALYTGGYLGGK